MSIFSYESRFSQLFLRFSYCCWLNLLWLICSWPIFTIGASTTALYYTAFKIVDDKDRHITRLFFDSFKKNFVQSTRIWLIMLVIGAVLATDGYIVYHLRSATTGPLAVMWTFNLALLICAAVVFTIVLLYLFPMVARFVNTDKNMFKNAFLIGFHYLFCTIMVIFIHFVMFYIVVFLFTPAILLGEGLCAVLSSYLLLPVFRTCTYEGEE